MDLPNGFDELCEEEQILVFFERLLEGWRQEVGGMTELEMQTARGKAKVATFNQCERNLGPLFELCRNKVRALLAHGTEAASGAETNHEIHAIELKRCLAVL